MTLRHCVREAQNGNHEATLVFVGAIFTAHQKTGQKV